MLIGEIYNSGKYTWSCFSRSSFEYFLINNRCRVITLVREKCIRENNDFIVIEEMMVNILT